LRQDTGEVVPGCRVDLLDGRDRLRFDGSDRPGVFEVKRKADPELRDPVLRAAAIAAPAASSIGARKSASVAW